MIETFELDVDLRRRQKYVRARPLDRSLEIQVASCPIEIHLLVLLALVPLPPRHHCGVSHFLENKKQNCAEILARSVASDLAVRSDCALPSYF